MPHSTPHSALFASALISPPKVVLAACYCFSSGLSEANAIQFVNAGGVELLLQVWRDHSTVPRLRGLIGKAFIGLAKQGVQGREYLVRTQYVVALVDAMLADIRGDLRMQYIGCRTLELVARDALTRDRVAVRAIRAATAAIDRFHDFTVQMSCSRAVAVLKKPQQRSLFCPCGQALLGACYGGGSCSAASPPPGDDVAVVLAHCSHRIGFLHELKRGILQAGLRLVSVTIIAKCGNETGARAAAVSALGAGGSDPQLRHALHIVRAEANVGRCDHSWASYLLSHYDALPSRLLMLKDTWDIHVHTWFERLNTSEILGSTDTASFACAYRFSGLWHATADLNSFNLAKYNKSWDQSGHGGAAGFAATERPFGRWVRAMQLGRSLETESFWPVCYGGGFAVTREAVRRVPREVWGRIVASLRRGENIEESHYMERTWAALLTPPLQQAEEDILSCATQDAIPSRREESTLGALQHCKCSHMAECQLNRTAAHGGAR